MDLSGFQLQETISKGDTVRIIGRDDYKGYLGTIIKTKELSGEKLYTIELEATSQRIERFQQSLRKQYQSE